jgi:hypothetical protein
MQMQVETKAITWLAGGITAVVLAFQGTSFVYAGDTISFTPGEFSRSDQFNWPGTYISDDAYNAHSERNVQKLTIEETHRKKANYYKVHAWLTGLQGFPSSEEVSVDDGTVEAYVELDHWPKVWGNDTIVASFPSVKDRPIIVITRGPLDCWRRSNSALNWRQE